MHFKTFAALLLPVLAVNALPAKRDDSPIPTDSAPLFEQQASSVLQAVSSELQSAGPSGSAFTAYITTINGRPVVEMSSVGGSDVFVAMTSGDSVQAPTPTSSASSETDSASDSTQSTGPTSTAKPSNAAGTVSLSKPLLTGALITGKRGSALWLDTEREDGVGAVRYGSVLTCQKYYR
ncbi:hypothetical protein BV20DRAFT_977856 [Pilatotrama ljubarskyi]|nr:hypothetical protein BV20DRAFT_977856 [Pilatotrama ljubarskyi]